MAEENITVQMNIMGQYIKDLSYEVPNAPNVFLEPPQEQPSIDLNLDVQVEGIADKIFEVTLAIQATANFGEMAAYIIELKYAGVLNLEAPEEHKAGILFVEVPRLLFPFARAILVDVTRDGGFQPLTLGPVDFAGLYQKNAENIQVTDKSD